MITLQTPYGDCYIRSVAEVVAISSSYLNPKAKAGSQPTRFVWLEAGTKLTVSDSVENMRLLVGPDYSPKATKPIVKRKAKRTPHDLSEE